MTEHQHPADKPDPDGTAGLEDLDARARAASRGLQHHVQERLDPIASLATLPTEAPRRRGRLVAVAAAVALLAGTVVVVGQDDDGDRIAIELDEDGDALPDLEPGVLRPLGPRDGKDSIQLPLTAEPHTGLTDGTLVTASATGFEPGEQVGIVQCAQEAGGNTPEERGGVDGCTLSGVVYAHADADGVASGQYPVKRVITTPLTGTVDCAAVAERCIIAMGAINDYDRSGGHALTFEAIGEPPAIPTVTVTPTEGLGHGDEVHVVAEGLTPNEPVGVTICSSDPAQCWDSGAALGAGAERTFGLLVDQDGRAEGNVPVWQFLPGTEPGTYIDCAVSRCSLRLNGQTAPPTVPLHFAAGAAPPTAPAFSIEPADGLAPGDEVLVRGTGFQSGAEANISFCADPAPGGNLPADGFYAYCAGGDSFSVDDDGTFTRVIRVPDIADSVGQQETCTEDGDGNPSCQMVTAFAPGAPLCDGVATSCYVSVDAYYYSDGPTVLERPIFTAAPVAITFR